MTTIEENVAAAQHEVERRKADYEHACDLYRRAVTVRDDLDAVARVHKATKNIYDAVQTITEQPAPEPAPTLDSDPGTPADQAHEFFTRPGDFYHVALALPAPTNGAKLGAGFIVKADDTQLPYLLEVLRQLRGALGDGTRVELTKAQITPPDGPPMQIGKDFTLGDRFPPMPRYTEVFALLPEPSLAEQIAEIAERQGVKPEQIQAIPVRGGGHAFTVKPEPQPEHGRHARPDDGDETRWEPCGRSGPCWKADGHDGDCTQ
ncbi:hypothetical protein [Mycobacteroides abscessus]|uniref:hypothetical protein n=1 Tax=Mycobacteroides abscessus TaxID=36809 RepID=UPI0009286D69|nr:hypothetical protein [Mycobacteroides abscessus]MDO2989273.1 hypothetical protein [Mycobacteroides abscessus subsp. massiliense]SID19937.1 Uncharacterised protein [Mycobacteroides abscessus subsp. abscessus]